MSKQILGRGLSSLIPQKNNQEPQNKANDAYPPNPPLKEEEKMNLDSRLRGNDNSVNPLENTGKTIAFRSLVSDTKQEKESVFYVESEKVRPNPHQPRRDFDPEALKDLAESIRRHGIIQPLIVTKQDQATSRGQEVWYELIAGERRLRAAQSISLKHVPVVIRDAHEEQKLEVALVENLQRDNLSPLEEARAFRKLMDMYGLSQQDVALRVGKSRPAVANTMRLLDLPQEIQRGLAEGKVTEGHARALLGLKDPVQQLVLYTETIQKNLNVREVEDVVHEQAVRAGTRKEREVKTLDPEVREFQNKLASALGTKVQVKGKTNRGKIVVEFYSREELQNIVDKMLKNE